MTFIRNLIGGLVVLAGIITMIGLSLYLLISGIVFLIQNGASLSASEIVWEIVVIIFRDIVSVVVGIVIMFIGLLIMKRRKLKRHDLGGKTVGEILQNLEDEEE